ncbi:MAG: GH25 family lysozyme [Candidatus Falkowbacteria bacterium]
MKVKIFLMLFLLVLCAAQVDLKDAGIKKTNKTQISFGIDVSENNGDINWKTVKDEKKPKAVKFVIIRSTMGADRKDKKFQVNYKEAKKNGFVVGAYHYFDPNESAAAQIKNFSATVTLVNGDIIPVLDIERISKNKSMDSLLGELKLMLLALDKKYGRKPMIYTSHNFYERYMKNHGFEWYPLWVAAYDPDKKQDDLVKSSRIHQFSSKFTIKGIHGKVDANIARNLHKIIL